MSRKLKFTIYHGIAASLVIHAAVALPFILNQLMPQPVDDGETLVFELQGIVADNQREQRTVQEIKGESKPIEEVVKPKETPPPPPEADPTPEAPPPEEQAQDAGDEPPPPPLSQPIKSPPAPTVETPPLPTETKTANAGSNNTTGYDEKQIAQTIKPDPEDKANQLRREYVKGLRKKVQTNLVYPNEMRQANVQGTATVSFTILGDGQIQPETLKIVTSSGQPKLDASALRTVRASVPFAQPPEQMTIAIAVGFGNKH